MFQFGRHFWILQFPSSFQGCLSNMRISGKFFFQVNIQSAQCTCLKLFIVEQIHVHISKKVHFVQATLTNYTVIFIDSCTRFYNIIAARIYKGNTSLVT